MNENTRPAPPYLFEWIFLTLFAGLCGLFWSVFQLFYVTF